MKNVIEAVNSVGKKGSDYLQTTIFEPSSVGHQSSWGRRRTDSSKREFPLRIKCRSIFWFPTVSSYHLQRVLPGSSLAVKSKQSHHSHFSNPWRLSLPNKYPRHCSAMSYGTSHTLQTCLSSGVHGSLSPFFLCHLSLTFPKPWSTGHHVMKPRFKVKVFCSFLSSVSIISRCAAMLCALTQGLLVP